MLPCTLSTWGGKMDKEVESLVSKFPELEVLNGARRIRCKLSGHEMPFTSKAIIHYTSGKKFKQLKADSEFSFDSYKPFIVPSEIEKDRLFCTLTGKCINKTPQQVKVLVKGRKYCYEKLLYEHGKKKLISEVNEKKEKSDEEEKSNEEVSMDEGSVEDGTESKDIKDDSQDDDMIPTVLSDDSNDCKRKRKLTTNNEGLSSSSKKLKLLLEKKRRSITKGQNSTSLIV